MDFTGVQAFRVELYHTFLRSKAVLMDIVDAQLVMPEAQSAIALTLSPAFRRQWPSFYQGLQQGRIDRQALRRLFCAHLPSTPGERLVLAVDPTSILRPHSPTARDRAPVHAANLPEDAKPIGIGWQYSALVMVPPTPSSWAYYLACTRIRPGTTPAQVAASQLASVQPWLSDRPLVLGDRYFGSATFVLHPGTKGYDKLVRIQTHRLFYRAPAPRQEGQRGRSRKYGAKFQPKDPTTHGEPSACCTTTDQRGRTVVVTAWCGLYFMQEMTRPVTLLRCARQAGPDSKRDPRVIWLLWESPTAKEHPAEPAPLADVPSYYARRFSIDHSFRFTKQELDWEEPRLRTPRQFDLWTTLLTITHNVLIFLRPVVDAIKLPWDRNRKTASTPAQVRRACQGIFPELGTPAPAPQPRGKAPGRRPGTRVKPATRYPIVYKSRPPNATTPAEAA